jgi:hypothetical protein
MVCHTSAFFMRLKNANFIIQSSQSITGGFLARNSALTLSDPMSDLVRHYGFPVPDAFLDL